MKLSILLTIAKLIIGQITPELKKGLKALINSLEEKAKQTANPWDDLLIKIIKDLLSL